MRRPFWQLAFTAALVALVGVLAALQYRWLGQVSDAERDRLRNSLRARATELADEFDRELTRTYLCFHVAPDVVERGVAPALADGYARAQTSSPAGGLVKAVYVIDADGPHANRLRRLDPAARTLEPAAWPAPFERWRQRAEHLALFAGTSSPIFVADAVDARTPALVVPIPRMQRIEQSGRVAVVPDPAAATRLVIVWLDADRLKRQWLESLVTSHFGAPEASEYVVTVVQRDDPSQVVYASGGDGVTPATAELSTGLFDLRLD